MSIKTAKPSPILQPYIKQYWCMENVLPNGEKHIQRIIPSGLPELSLYIGSRPQILGNKKDFEDTILKDEESSVMITNESSENTIVSRLQEQIDQLQQEKESLKIYNICLKKQNHELKNKTDNIPMHFPKTSVLLGKNPE